MSESAIRSREEDEELQRSTKKVKDSHRVGASQIFSFKEKLIGEIPRAFEQAFDFENHMDTEVESNNEFSEIPLGEAVVRLSGERKASIQAPWANALIVKVFGRTMGYHFLHSRLLGMWKPVGLMSCIALSSDFFLIRFSVKEDYVKVLCAGPWFVGGHYLSIRSWEPNFKVSSANLSSVAVWIRLPELPIEYYESFVLKDIGTAIGPILQIDTHTTTKARGWFARLCIQVNLDKLIIKLIRVGGIAQQVQYEGISSLCFAYGRVGHKTEGCSYQARTPESNGKEEEAGKGTSFEEQKQKNEEVFGPWVLVTQKRQNRRKVSKDPAQATPLGPTMPSPMFHSPLNPSSPVEGAVNPGLGSNEGKRKSKDSMSSSAIRAYRTTKSLNADKLKASATSAKGRTNHKGQNYHKMGKDSSNKKGIRTSQIPRWEAANTNSFGPSSSSDLDSGDFSGLNLSIFQGFSAGGSTKGLPLQPLYNREKDLGTMECHDKALTLNPVALSKGDGRDDVIVNDNMEEQSVPPQGSTNHAGSSVGQGELYLKAMASNISNANLKHINPSLRSRGMLANDFHEQELLCIDRSGVPNSSLEEMVLEDGVTSNSSQSTWLLSAVYASLRVAERRLLWDNLCLVSNLHSLPWVITGDFNEVLIGEDKFGGRPVNMSRAIWFQDCLNHCKIINIGFFGLRFTWSNHKPLTRLIQERLDRVFVNAEWSALFLEARVKHFERSYSNHYPVMLSTDSRHGLNLPQPFRFQPIWLSHQTFPGVVNEAWANSIPLARAVEEFPIKARAWNINIFRNLFHRKKRVLARLKGVQVALSSSPNNFLVDLEQELKAELFTVSKLEKEF
ncbi:uncharacterized protein LOC142640060 [Castanea sativa]|uniref:uncharacterized protein LOC142640060 n=1 Tax=Castanea sativa TaxID=21020 RepID=UPI003F64DC6F